MIKPVKYHGRVVIPVVHKNNEDMASLAYDRVYKLYDYDKIMEHNKREDRVTLEKETIDQSFLYSKLEVRATTELPFEEVNDLPPIRFNYQTYVDIEVAKPIVKSDWGF